MTPCGLVSWTGKGGDRIRRKDFIMTDQPNGPDVSAVRDAARPSVASRAAFQSELDRLRAREKAHTREGDAIAAARRRLPVVDRVFETYWTTGRGNEPMAPSYGLLDMTVYGRQEFWEDSPEGWPQRWGSQGGQFRLDGRPAAQWSRIEAGRDDDLGPMPDGWTACSCSLHQPSTD
jgi:hypothetical protein